jgi:hypothetical protein
MNMLTDNQLRELRQQLHQRIDTLSDENLRALKYFIDALEKNNRQSLREQGTEYITVEEDTFGDEALEKGLLELFQNNDFRTREPYKPGDTLCPLEEVFDELYNRLDKHYGVDLRTL